MKENKPQLHQQFPFLDGFRALGILMIVGHHMCVGFNLYQLFDSDSPILTWVFFKSWRFLHLDLSYLYIFIEHIIYHFKGILGVQIFFIISGFLITRNLLDKAETWSGICQFWWRRFLRIYPAYIMLVVISFVFLGWQGGLNSQDVLSSVLRYVFFLQNYFPRNIYLEHTWTLAVFEQFYIICPLIIFCIYKIWHQIQSRRKALMIICCALMCLGAVIKYGYIVLGVSFITGFFKSPSPHFTLTYHLGSLSLGCLLAVLKPRWKNLPKNRTIGWLLWIAGATGYCFLLFVIDWGYNWGSWYLSILGYLSTLALLAAAFSGVSFVTNLKFMQWLGRHSYGIYLWHILVISFWAQWMTKLSPTIIIVGSLMMIIGMGVLSSMTIERYFLQFRDKK